MSDLTLQKVAAALSSFAQRARKGEPLALAATAATGGVLGFLVLSWAFSLADGPAHMSEEQKALSEAREVSTSAGRVVRVRRVLPGEGARAAEVLADSLCANPVLLSCASESHDSASRRSALASLYRATLQACLPSAAGAVCLRTESGDAVSVWLPHGVDLGLATLALHGALGALARFGGWARLGRLWLYSQAVVPRRQRLTSSLPRTSPGAGGEGKFYYLLMSGAVGAGAAGAVAAGAGAGAAAGPGARAGAGAMPSSSSSSSSSLAVAASREAVILPVLQRADAMGAAVFAELTDTAEVPFFQGLGFATVDQFTLFGVPIAIMMRKPKTAGAPAAAAAPGGR